MRQSVTIGIAGAGGDGVIIAGSFLQRLSALQGYYSQMPRYYGAQIRGGGSAVKLSLDADAASFPRDSLDVLVCFDWERYLEVKHELALTPETLVFYEQEPAARIELPRDSFLLDFSGASRSVSGSTRGKNVVALAVLIGIIGLRGDLVKKAIEEDEELIILKHNLPAFEAGERLHSQLSIPPLNLPPAADATPRVILSGNSAMAQAALRAGSKAFFGYPITPASEIMKEIYQGLIYDDGVFLQAEDEITAAGLTIGASVTGAKSLTATSGPGFDLMTEMMGLATISETPMVIVDVQRGGPSTGIPSGTEQSDLNHAIYGGHGDAPRTILAPFDIEGCYRLTIESLNIAERYQCVVVLLSDQWLAQTLVATSDAFLRDDPVIWDRKRPGPEDAADYLRYKLTDDLVSPMASVGDEGFSYRTSGLSHDEKGRPAFDSEVNQTMHDKRWKKLASLAERDELVRLFGNEDSSRGVIAWGSTAQAVLETIRDLGLHDKVKLAVPELIFPLPHAVRRFVESTDKLLVVEMNHSGQFYHYLRSRVDLPKDTRLVARAGSRPFTRQELGGPMSELAA